MYVSYTVLGLGLLLQLLLLIRGWQIRNLGKFPYFYAYIFAVTGITITGYFLLVISRPGYLKFYWMAQFFSLAIGCGLILEIFKHVLSDYPGAERFARWVCVITFGSIFLFALIYPAVMPSPGVPGSQIELERDVRTAQIIFFVGIVAVIAHYGILLGKNMRGMIYGYGIYLGASLVTLALRSYLGVPFDTTWNFIQPLSFDVSLLIWLSSLWVYSPNPVPAAHLAVESDYMALAMRTRHAMGTMRSYLGRSIR